MSQAEMRSPYLDELQEKVRAVAWAEGLAEGRLNGTRDLIIRFGRQRFDKAASRKQKAQLKAIIDVARLERIHDRLLTAESWDDLLATLREAILRLGRQRFDKAASRKQKAQLKAIFDVARLERIHDRLLTAESWDDLLATP